jgi:hypothetical protein
LALVGGAFAGPAVGGAQAAPVAKPVTADVVPDAPQAKPVTAAKALDDIASKPAVKSVSHDFQLQPNFYYCGPAATRIALSANGHELSQDEIAQKLGTTTDGTNSAEEITKGLNGVIGGDRYKTTSMGDDVTPEKMDKLQADVVHALNDGRPVVANIAGTAMDTDGGTHSYEGGHYLTIVGYSDQGKTVEIADPANPNGTITYKVNTIDMAKWMATRGYSA